MKSGGRNQAERNIIARRKVEDAVRAQLRGHLFLVDLGHDLVWNEQKHDIGSGARIRDR